MRQICYVLLFMLLTRQSSAQQFLTGKVSRKEGHEALVSVNVYNQTQHRHRLSDESGNYRIQSQPGDIVIFSAVGYHTDTIPITPDILLSDFQVLLDERVVSLQSVTVGSLTNYQVDSLARREEYSWIYDQGTQPLINHQRQDDGVGVDINILRNASYTDRDLGNLKKRLLKEEEQHYVDFRFSRDYVSRLTHLQGDSLQQFMIRYRPSYDFCRKAANVDILVYISDSFKAYEKGLTAIYDSIIPHPPLITS
jgi:hypothetical protein